MDIKFGTDGWRDVIADGFTFENVQRVTQAACDVIRKTSRSKLLLIGYDRRFYSRQFAEKAADVSASNGFRVELSNRPISSPTLSFNVRDKKASMGFMITASHNPPQFNGFKLKGPHGGSVNAETTRAVESALERIELKSGRGTFKNIDFSKNYFKYLKNLVKRLPLHHLTAPVVFDGMHGPGAQLFEELMGQNKKIQFIRKEPDPLFGGVNPEPIELNLRLLREVVVQSKAQAGIAVDGDADRMGVLDERGHFLPPHTVMPLLLLHLIENRRLKGKIVQTVSMGYLPQRIARAFNLPFEEVPVGFKFVAEKIGREKVLLGGEESGGYGVGLWSPERDGLLCALLLLELMTIVRKPLSALVQDLMARFGQSHFKRVDFKSTLTVEKNVWTQRISDNAAKEIGGLPVKTVNAMDGVKIILQDDSWVLMRPSGTEPLIRTYSEASSSKLMAELLTEADRLIHLPLQNGRKNHAKGKKRSPRKGQEKANALTS